jgi:hypothetical protein
MNELGSSKRYSNTAFCHDMDESLPFPSRININLSLENLGLHIKGLNYPKKELLPQQAAFESVIVH